MNLSTSKQFPLHPAVYISTRLGNTRDRLKIYPDPTNTTLKYVHLDDNDTFELEFENYTQVRYIAFIYMNGVLISSGGLVIDPGQHVYLERHIEEVNGEKRKFRFNTYKVDDTPNAINAIKQNGLVTVKFFKEICREPGINFNKWFPQPNIDKWWTQPSIDKWWTKPGIDNTDINWHCVSGSGGSYQDVNYTCCTTFSTLGEPAKIETGRVEHGEISNQALFETYGEWSTICDRTYTYKILPSSTIKKDFGEQIRNYCSSCGYRIRKSHWKYCPSCGEEV